MELSVFMGQTRKLEKGVLYPLHLENHFHVTQIFGDSDILPASSGVPSNESEFGMLTTVVADAKIIEDEFLQAPV